MNRMYKKYYVRRSHKLKQERSQFEEIPIPIIWDILLKLPTRTCLVCKLVCKDWYNIISDTEFANLRRSHGCYISLLLCDYSYKSENAITLVDIEKTSTSIADEMGNLNTNNIDSVMELKPELVRKLAIVNECNGVILFVDNYESNWCSYIICNLLTGQYAFLNKTSIQGCYGVWMVGIGCCPVSRELKLVRIIFHREKRSRRVGQVKTLGTNEWRNLDKRTPLPRSFCSNWYCSRPVYLNDSIHTYSNKDKCIWSFHFGTEKFSAISLPDSMREEKRVVLSVLDSCLCLNAMDIWGAMGMEEVNICPHNIWVMKDYGVKDSWVKQFIVYHTDKFYSMPLWYIDKEKVLVSCGYKGIREYDVGSKTSEKVHVVGFSHVEATIINPMFTKLQWSDVEEEEELTEVEIERAVRKRGRGRRRGMTC